MEDSVEHASDNIEVDIIRGTTPQEPSEGFGLTTEKKVSKKWYHDGNARRLVSMAVLVAAFAAVEFIFGIVTNSLALMADAFHMLSDLISLIIGLLSLQMGKKAKTREYSYGWIRAETIGALINGVFLVSVSFYILLEALQRFITPPELEDPFLVVVVGGGGLLVNLIGIVMFAGHAHGGGGHSHGHGHGHKENDNKSIESPSPASSPRVRRNAEDRPQTPDVEEVKAKNLNLHAVLLHVLGDFLGSVGAIASGLGIWLLPFKEKIYLDPLCSVLIACIILASSIPLVKNCVRILMQSVPTNLDLENIEQQILKIEGVISVHEFHIWQLSNTKVIGTVHISCAKTADFFIVATTIKGVLHKQGVHSTTIQPEFVDAPEQAAIDKCALTCQSSRCQEKLCCASTAKTLTNRSKNKV